MNLRHKLLWLLAILPALILVAACSEDDEEETTTKEYMSGSVYYPMCKYVAINDIITTTVGGITNPSDVIYKWYFSLVSADTITTRTLTFKVPDTLGTFTISASAYYEGYYSSSNSMSMVTIDTRRDSSLVGIKYSDKTFVDNRDGIEYQYVTIGNLDWFAQNLAWDGAGVPFMNSPVTHTLFGRLYWWNEATGGVSASGLGQGPQGVCPQGWSVPTNEDWLDLANAVHEGQPYKFSDKWDGVGADLTAEAYLNGDRLWPYSPDNGHSNKYGWNGLPVGNTQFENVGFRGFQNYGFWWSSTEKNDTQAYFRYIYYDYGTFPSNYTMKEDFGASVRCVRLSK